MNMRKKTNEKGMVLIITLMITALLVVLITEIVYSVHVHLTMTSMFADGQGAGLLAEGGVDLASALIREEDNELYTYIKEEDLTQTIPIGENLLNVSVVDEHGKVSINALVFKNGETNQKFYDIYLRLIDNLGLDDELADTAADWADINDEPRSKGAENYDYYDRLGRPYSSKGAPFDSFEELLLVKGYTLKVVNKLRPFVTPYTDGLVNINSAPKEVIMALSEKISEETADEVVEFRKKNPFKTKADIRKVKGLETIGFDLQNLITVKSSVFRIFSKGISGEAIREVEAVIKIKGSSDAFLQGKGATFFWRER